MKRSAPGIALAFLTLMIVWMEINGKINTKIVNGTPAEIEDYPYIVGIMIQGFQKCGGAIIADRYVLTAAHCLAQRQEVDVAVFCGTPYIDGKNGSTYQSEKFIIHQDYDSQYNTNDIALIRIKNKIEYSVKIQPIQVADPDFLINTGDMCDIVGWGNAKEGGSPPGVLHKAQIPVYDHEKCASMYDIALNIRETIVCAGYVDGGINTCQGDSGGPLVLHNTVIGVVSLGIGCARKYPTVYTDVRRYTDWISQNLDQPGV